MLYEVITWIWDHRHPHPFHDLLFHHPATGPCAAALDAFYGKCGSGDIRSTLLPDADLDAGHILQLSWPHRGDRDRHYHDRFALEA